MQFSPGDIIQDFEEPFVKYLHEEFKGQRCYSCFLSPPMLIKCPVCQTVSYCSLDCQIADWINSHSIECILLSKWSLSSLKDDSLFRVIKLMAYLKKNPFEATNIYHLYDGTRRCFYDLQDNYWDISNSKTITNSCKTLAMTLINSNMFSLAEANYPQVIQLYGIWTTNSCAVNNESYTKTIGAALYVSASAFDHSCRPNALHVINASFRLQVRCIDGIPFGETPKISYLTGVHPRNIRQEILYDRCYFTCDCKLCQMERDTPMVDYDDVNRRQTELIDKMWTMDDFQRAMDFSLDLRKIFCQYDERIAFHFLFTLDKLVFQVLKSSDHLVTPSKVKEFAKQVDENLRITYGTDHIYYKCFIEQLQPRLRDV